MADETHPLHGDIFVNKSGRIRMPNIKTKRFRNSFLPSAVREYNKRQVR